MKANDKIAAFSSLLERIARASPDEDSASLIHDLAVALNIAHLKG